MRIFEARFKGVSRFFLLPKSLFGEHKDDDSMIMCLSNSQDDDSTPTCLSNSQHDASMPMCLSNSHESHAVW